MTLNEQAEAAAFPNTFRAGVAAAVARIEQHIPSLSDRDEDEINGLVARISASLFLSDPDGEVDVAGLALRTCHCGAKLDGFYEYVDHLKDVLRDD